MNSDCLAARAIRASVAGLNLRTEIVVVYSGKAALAAMRSRPAQLALVDLALPDVDGLDLILVMRRERLARRVLVISDRQDERTREFLREVRVDGCFDPVAEDPRRLPEAIGTIMEGRPWHSPARGDVASDAGVVRPKLLSPSEVEVFAIVGGGLDEQRAADFLGISRNTVHTHLEHVMRKLGVRTRSDVMREALRRGFVRFTTDRILYPGLEDVLAGRRRRLDERPG